MMKKGLSGKGSMEKRINLPVFIVNFKTYKEGTGIKALELAQICEETAKKTGKNIIIAVQEPDIYRISHEVSIPIFSEHMDPIDYGAHTGHVAPEDLKENGAVGCLLNHSEDKFRIDDLEKSIEIAKELNLMTVACANNTEIAESIAVFKPDAIAIEPPELIGGNISVSSAKPELIKESIEKIKKIDPNIPVLCGAGIKTMEDVRKAIELGTQGVLIASGIVKAKNPRKKLEELLKGFD